MKRCLLILRRCLMFISKGWKKVNKKDYKKEILSLLSHVLKKVVGMLISLKDIMLLIIWPELLKVENKESEILNSR